MANEDFLVNIDDLAERLATDPDDLRQEIEQQLIDENGQDWFNENKKFLDRQWEAALALIGF